MSGQHDHDGLVHMEIIPIASRYFFGVNAYLLKTGEGCFMIDTGLANLSGPRPGPRGSSGSVNDRKRPSPISVAEPF